MSKLIILLIFYFFFKVEVINYPSTLSFRLLQT